mmetsp:Transcript_101280/g.287035  ORF Transcript_101280/g.287035 Transcript_101280/m.287035 type:complete len:256 (+) Transcript_101280:504-1271(+)
MPRTIEHRRTRLSADGLPASSTQMGPGQAEHAPQPAPKSRAPTTRLRSAPAAGGGSSKAAPRTQHLGPRRSSSWKNGSVRESAAAMTKARDGSQAPEPRSRNAAILLGLAMPLMTRPHPKASPLMSSAAGADCPAHVRWRTAAAAEAASNNPATVLAATAAASGHAGTPDSEAVSGGKAPELPKAVAVAMPAAMKVGTAVQERRLSRARPVRPCPDVQPLASIVPRPTRTPPAASRNRSQPGWLEERGGNGSKPP